MIGSLCSLSTLATDQQSPPSKTSVVLADLALKPKVSFKKFEEEKKYKELISYYPYKPSKELFYFLCGLLFCTASIPLYTLAFIFKKQPWMPTFEGIKLTLLVMNLFFLLVLFFVNEQYTKRSNEGGVLSTDTGIGFIDSGLETKAQWAFYEDIKLIGIDRENSVLRVKAQKDHAFCYFNHIKNTSKTFHIELSRNQLGSQAFNLLSAELATRWHQARIDLILEKIRKEREKATTKLQKIKKEHKENLLLKTKEDDHGYIPDVVKQKINEISKKNGYNITDVTHYYPHRVVEITDLIIPSITTLISFALLFIFYSFIENIYEEEIFYYLLILLDLFFLVISIDSLIGKIATFFNHQASGHLLTNKGLLVLLPDSSASHQFFPYQKISCLVLNPFDSEEVFLMSTDSTLLHSLKGAQVASEKSFHSLLEELEGRIVRRLVNDW